MKMALERLRFGKFGLLLGVLWLGIVPWASGAKEPVAVLVSFLALALATIMVIRLPKVVDLRGQGLVFSALFFVGWSGLSLIWSVNRYRTVQALILELMAVAAFAVAYQFSGQWPKFRHWASGYLIIATIFSVIGGWIYLTGEYTRLTSTFYWANPMAAWLLPAVILAGWFFITGQGRLYLVAAAVCGVALVLTDSRSAYLILGIIGIGIFGRVRLQPAAWLRLLLAVILVVVAALGVNATRARLSHRAVVAPGSRLAEAVKGESNSSRDRLYYLASAGLIWLEHPLLGTGAGTYGSVHPHYQLRVVSASTSAHNYYVQTLAETGLPGLVSLGLLVVALILGGWRRVKQHPKWWPVLIVMVALLLHLGLDIDSEYPTLLILTATLAGFLYYSPQKSSSQVATRYPKIILAGLVALGLPTISLYQSQLSSVKGGYAQDDGDYAQAAEYYQRAHAGVAYNPDVITAEGINYYAAARVGENSKTNLAMARNRAEVAAKVDSFDAQHGFLLARVLRQMGDKGAAEDNYKRAIKLDPYNNPEYYSDLVGLQLEQNRPDEALRQINKVLDLYPQPVITNRAANTALARQISILYATRALILDGKGDRAAATVDLKEALKLDPVNPLANQLLVQFKASK